MAYKDKYKKYLDNIPNDIKRCVDSSKQLVMGYTSDYDVVLVWNVDTYNDILESYLKEEPEVTQGDTINSIEDFARISCAYLVKGLGGTFDITKELVCDFLKNSFKTEDALGGTCAQGATAISTLGFPINVHLTDKSKEVCSIMDNPGVTLVKNGDLVPISKCSENKTPIYHFILQFTKGDVIKVCGKEYEIPLSNRLILPYDNVHKILPIEENFINYWNVHSDKMHSYLISGFDAIVEEDIMKERGDQLEKHIIKMRENCADFILYFEGAYYMNTAVEKIAEEYICRHTDIFGMNEEELYSKMKKLGIDISLDNPRDIIKSLDSIIFSKKVGGIILHTKDYAMYYGKKLNIDIEKGLTIGNLMSGTRARIGRYGTWQECAESLTLPLSPAGLVFAEKLGQLELDKFVCIVPSRYMEKPKYTIGLGDTFVSGVHTCFIQ